MFWSNNNCSFKLKRSQSSISIEYIINHIIFSVAWTRDKLSAVRQELIEQTSVIKGDLKHILMTIAIFLYRNVDLLFYKINKEKMTT